MRIECPSCLQVAEAQLIRITEQEASFACFACRAEMSARLDPGNNRRASQEAPSQETSARAGDCCPKCEGPVAQELTHCPACGLAKEKFAGFDRDEFSAPLELTDAWLRVQSNWGDDAVHEGFAAEVARTGNYRTGARWYRQAVGNRDDGDKDRGNKAQDMLDRIQSMATAALLSAKPKITEEKEPFKGVVILLMVMVLLAAGIGLFLMTRDSGNAKEHSPAQWKHAKPESR